MADPLPRDDEPDQKLSSVLSSADHKLSSDEVAYRRLRPKPAELQTEMSVEARHELATERYLLDGFFKAKLQNAENELELTDVLILRNLQAVAKSLVDRSKTRRG